MPVTVTFPLNVTVMLITEPAPYVPSTPGEATPTTVVAAAALVPLTPLRVPPGASPATKNAPRRCVWTV